MLFLSLFIGLLRLHTYNEPRSYDVTYFAVVAHGLLHGQKLYSQLWDNKPPAPYLTYAAAELLFGYGRLELYMLGFIAAVTSLWGIYVAVFGMTRNRAAATWSAIFWVVISSGLQFDANEPNCEVFVNACVTWMIALLVSKRGALMSTRRALLIGALFALASLYKPFFILHALLFAVIYVCLGGRSKCRQAILDVSKMAGVGAATWLATIAYFAATGRWRIFYDSNVTYNNFYSPHPLLEMANATSYFVPPVSEQWSRYAALLALLALGLLLGRSSSDRYSRWMLCSFAIATYMAVAIPGKFFNHYFQLWLPVVAMAAGWSIDRLGSSPISRYCRVSVVASCALGIVIACQLPDYRLTPEQSSERYYEQCIVEIYRTSSIVESLLRPGEQLLQLGDNPAFYFLGHRTSPTGVLFAYHLSGPLRSTLCARLIDDLQRSRPEIVVVDSSAQQFLGDRQLQSILSEQYEPIPGQSDYYRFRLLMRRGGALGARIGNGRAPSAVQNRSGQPRRNEGS